MQRGLFRAAAMQARRLLRRQFYRAYRLSRWSIWERDGAHKPLVLGSVRTGLLLRGRKRHAHALPRGYFWQRQRPLVARKLYQLPGRPLMLAWRGRAYAMHGRYKHTQRRQRHV